jgi:hypothetical protein
MFLPSVPIEKTNAAAHEPKFAACEKVLPDPLQKQPCIPKQMPLLRQLFL